MALHSPSHDPTPYGLALADQVAEALFQGYAFNYGHPAYCGTGFDVADGHFRYGEVWEGGVEPRLTFATRPEFVRWLAEQSDALMAGPPGAGHAWDAQVVTRRRLLALVQSMTAFTATQERINALLTQLLKAAGCPAGRLRARFPAGTALVSLAGQSPEGRGVLVWPLEPPLPQLLRQHIEETYGPLVMLTIDVDLVRPAFHYRYVSAGAQNLAVAQAVAATRRARR